MCMAYMTVGVLFIIVFGVEIAYYSVYLDKSLDNYSDDEEELIGHPVRFNDSVLIPIVESDWDKKKLEKSCVVYIALMCTGL